MDSVSLILLFLTVMVCAALAGMAIGSRLPEHHLRDSSREAMLRYVGLVVTLSGLVLAFIVSSANSYYESVDRELTEVASDIAALDRVLSRLGPDGEGPRQLLRQGVNAAVQSVWGDGTAAPPGFTVRPGMGAMGQLADAIDALPATDARQASLRDEAAALTAQIQHSAYKLNRIRAARAEAPLLAIIVSWLAIVFLGFGLVSPRTSTAITAMALAAIAAAGALFLVIELFSPVRGLIRIEPSVLLDALPAIGAG
jgi:hypothetical protein